MKIMDNKFWQNSFEVGDREVIIELNDIKKIEFNLESNKCYVFIDDTNEGIEISHERAIIAIQSNKIWRPIP